MVLKIKTSFWRTLSQGYCVFTIIFSSAFWHVYVLAIVAQRGYCNVFCWNARTEIYHFLKGLEKKYTEQCRQGFNLDLLLTWMV